MAYPIELILSRQLAECLDTPVFLTDTVGNLLFYNEPAEDILGKRFEDTGEMPVDEWGTVFKNKDDAGNPIPVRRTPIGKNTAEPFALSQNVLDRKPAGKGGKNIGNILSDHRQGTNIFRSHCHFLEIT